MGVTYCGATPVFVDCTPDTWEIDASKIEEKITDKTKAVIGVHLYGQPFDFGAVKRLPINMELLSLKIVHRLMEHYMRGERSEVLA